MKRAALLLIVSCAAAFGQNRVTFSGPPVATDCRNGLAKATLQWNVPIGPVQVRVGGSKGAPMTGWEPAAGSAETGYWVSGDTKFILVAQPGDSPVAATIVRSNCGGQGDSTVAALAATNGYLPLQIGNRWIYRTDNRAETSGYFTTTVTRTATAANHLYYVLQVRPSQAEAVPHEMWMRAGDDGQLYRYNTSSGLEDLWLDPTAQNQGILKVVAQGVPLPAAFGEFTGGLLYQGYLDGLTSATGDFQRGLGQTSQTSSLNTGSSGGFLEGIRLIEARAGDGLLFQTSTASVSLGAESTKLNVTARQVMNCAIPCYFTACGIAGADPEGTWKPCFQARVRVTQPGWSQKRVFDADLELLGPGSNSLYRRTIAIDVPERSFEGAAYHQVPLYTAPNVPLPAGDYRLLLTVRDGAEQAGSASLPVHID